ncbi:MAG: amino acid adenylation domain-containing protein [Chroococcales cyanobacterium]
MEGQAQRTPDAVAVEYANGVETLHATSLQYGELNAKANQLAHYLQSLGVKPGVLVGLCVDRSANMMIALLGILKTGGAYIPLDPAYPAERLGYMLNDSQAPILLTESALLTQLPSSSAKVICLDDHWAEIEKQPTHTPVQTVTENDLAYILYTSGSTGKPKGVQIPHRALTNFLLSMQETLEVTSQDTFFAVTSLSFDIAALELFLPLLTGSRLVIASREVAANGIALAQQLAITDATVMQATPATWRLLLNANWEGQPSLKILCGGEALSLELAQELLKKGSTVWNLYGPTETTIWSTACEIQSTDEKISIGRPIANTKIYILDSYLQPVPVGVTGELYIGGVGLAKGYLNRPELTAERFIIKTTEDTENTEERGGERLYRTGDLARYLPNGQLECLGRIDSQVKIRGFRIELGEIESVLTQQDGIKEAVVVAREDNPGDKQLVAYLVTEGGWPTVAELRRLLKQQLPDYMIPGAFVTLEKLPLTPNGKVNRRALPAPEITVNPVEVAIPRTPIEELLVNIWQEVLNLDVVGIEDDFFELGGHSLRATQLVSRIQEAFNLEIPLRCLFEAPTIAQFAQEIERIQRSQFFPSQLPLVPISRTESLPLSFAQQRLWVLESLEEGSTSYHIADAVRIEGSLNVKALEQSFEALIQRHETLRTYFINVEGQAVQKIESSLIQFSLPIVNLSSLSPIEQEKEVQRLALTTAQAEFELSQAPLLRSQLICLSDTEYILVLSLHHIISDAWSMGVLVQELIAFYQGYSQNQSVPLPPLPIQYVDFASWQRQWFQGKGLEEQLSYWKAQLKDAPAILELPTDRPRPAIQRLRGKKRSLLIPQALTSSLKALSRQENVTLFMTLLAGFQTLLYRYSGQNDILVGSPIANRSCKEIEGLIGFFVNTLVLRTQFSNGASFRELLAQVREVTLGAYSHQDLPFEMLVEQLQPERNLSHTPLFQVMFVLNNTPATALELPELTLQPLEIDRQVANFDLTLSLTETETGLAGYLEYNTDLFNPNTIDRMVGHFQVLLEGIAANPDQSVAQLPLLTQAEIQQLQQWNATKRDYNVSVCVHSLIEQQAERTPNAIAVEYTDGASLHYGELNAKANQLAHYLQSLGVKPGVLVGLCVERSLNMIIALLGILKAGGTYIPLDPAYPTERLGYMLNDSQAPILLTQSPLINQLPDSQARIICLDSIEDEIAQQPTHTPPQTVTENDLAYIIYTSGSTGKPKGVQIPHRALINFLLSMQETLEITPQDTFFAVTSLSFDIAALELFLPLLIGSRLVIASREVATDGIQLAQQLAQRKATFMQATPATWRMLLNANWQGQSSLKILCGGEALPLELAQQLLKKGSTVWNLYGPTETTIWSTVCEVQTTDEMISIGRPIANTKVYILDGNQQVLPIGIPGELHIGGLGLAKGYLNRPELTAERFIIKTTEDAENTEERKGERLYRTGDLARYREDGTLECLGRLDYQVKLRGFRIELGEIEAALRQHSAVEDAVVLLREDEPGQKRLVAYLVGEETTPLSVSEWRNWLNSFLPNYMIPGVFMTLPTFPLTSNGKINRLALPMPIATESRLDSFVSPRNGIEAQLAKIWAELLGVERVGMNDNFFELGGDSILSLQVTAKANQAGLSLTSKQLFQYQTIAELATVVTATKNIDVEQELPDVSIPLASLNSSVINSLVTEDSQVEDIYPLSHTQAGMLFHTLYEPESGVYFIQSSCTLKGNVNVAALESAWETVIERHSILRTGFVWEGLNEPLQLVYSKVSLPLEQQNWEHLSEEEKQSKWEQLLESDRNSPFNLSDAPLLRLKLIRLDSETYKFVWSSHHLILDGWSCPILFKEVLSLYQAYSQDLTITLDSPRPYRDYIAWLQGQDLGKAETFWRESLSQFSTPTPLPLRIIPQLANATETQQQVKLSADVTQAIQTFVRQHQLTLNTVIQGVWALLLSHYSNHSDVVFGATVSGRPADLIGVDSIIGLFINTLPVRVNLPGNTSIIEWLKGIQNQQVNARQYEYTPLNKIQEWSELPTASKLFETLVVFENYPVNPANMTEDLGLGIEAVSFAIANNYPLTLRVVPGKELLLVLMFDNQRFSRNAIADFLQQIEQILTQIPKLGKEPLTAVLNQLQAAKQEQQQQQETQLKANSLKKLKLTGRKAIRKPIR